MQYCNRIAMFLFIVLLSSCAKQSTDQGGVNPTSSEYIFYVTRVSYFPQVQYPGDTLSESQYRPDSSGKSYTVRLSPDGQQVFIKNDSIVGIKVTETEKTINYNLVSGVFAGGRFVIWPKGQPVEAELTIYGSGVPIIYSERGDFIEQDK